MRIPGHVGVAGGVQGHPPADVAEEAGVSVGVVDGLVDGGTLETLVLPLIDNSIYTEIARGSGKPVPMDLLPTPKREIGGLWGKRLFEKPSPT